MTDSHDDLDDDLDQDEQPPGQQDHSPLIRKLRRQLRDAKREAGEAAGLKAKVAALERREAARKAGLDLTDAQLAALGKVHEGGDTPEALRATAASLGWATAEEPSEEEQRVTESAAAQQRISDAQRGAPPARSTQITPADAAGWAIDKQMAFDEKHPDLYEALMRGETVTAPIGF